MGQWLCLAISISFLIAGCKGKEGATSADNRPSELRGAAASSIGAMCFLERVNNKSVRTHPELRAGQPGVFSGWANVADAAHPAPELVHVILRPAASGPTGDVYLKMGRAPRPELSGGDERREMVGFEGEAALPAPGSYDVLVSQSNGKWQAFCRTGVVLDVVQ